MTSKFLKALGLAWLVETQRAHRKRYQSQKRIPAIPCHGKNSMHTGTYHAALALEQQAKRMPAFACEKTIVRATKGAAETSLTRDSPRNVHRFRKFREQEPYVLARSARKLSAKMPTAFEKRFCDSVRFQLQAQVRPGELEVMTNATSSKASSEREGAPRRTTHTPSHQFNKKMGFDERRFSVVLVIKTRCAPGVRRLQSTEKIRKSGRKTRPKERRGIKLCY